MKKKFLIATILLASMCTAIVGCNSNTTNEQLEAEILSEIEALPDEAIENVDATLQFLDRSLMDSIQLP